MKKTLLLILSLSSLIFAEGHKLQKIEIKNNSENQKVVTVKETQEEFKLKNFKDIKYDKDILKFSIILHDKEAYKIFLKKEGLTPYFIKKIFGTVKNLTATKISALGFDWVYQKPNIAENFYIKLRKYPDLSLITKIYIADYYLRTGRPAEIDKVLTRLACRTSFKYAKQCYYYLGIAEYLLTMNKNNTALSIAKDSPKIYKLMKQRGLVD